MESNAYNGTENYIYLSGAEKNANKISPLLITLREAGCNVWYDNNADIDTATERIESCSYFMAYVTEAYVGSEKCIDELNCAVQLGKKLLLIFGDNTELPKGMLMRLNRVQAIYRSKYPELHGLYAKILQTEAVRACGGTYRKKAKGKEKTYVVEYDDTKTVVKSVLNIVGWIFAITLAIMTIVFFFMD